MRQERHLRELQQESPWHEPRAVTEGQQLNQCQGRVLSSEAGKHCLAWAGEARQLCGWKVGLDQDETLEVEVVRACRCADGSPKN